MGGFDGPVVKTPGYRKRVEELEAATQALNAEQPSLGHPIDALLYTRRGRGRELWEGFDAASRAMNRQTMEADRRAQLRGIGAVARRG